MSRAILVFLVPLLLISVACGTESNETERAAATGDTSSNGIPTTPEATVTRMLELAEAGDWGTYVDDFYGDTDKFSSTRDRDKLAARFEIQWGPGVVEALRYVKDIKPVVSEDGKRAVFRIDDSTAYTLYRDNSGNWKFHL